MLFEYKTQIPIVYVLLFVFNSCIVFQVGFVIIDVFYYQYFNNGSRTTIIMTSFKTPPVWGPEQPFHIWKNEVDVWKLLTDLPVAKQALAVALSLDGRRREVAMEVSAAVMATDTGMTTLLEKLETVFAKDSVDIAFESYCAFENLKRLGTETVADFILKFERCYSKVEQNKMKLPDNVLACKLLNGANLDDKERQMVLAASTELKFATMKSSLKRIFSTTAAQSVPEISLDVKTEQVFAVNDVQEQESALWTGSRGKFSHRRRPNYEVSRRSDMRRNIGDNLRKKEETGTNPTDVSGRITTCRICGSRYHWRQDCPEKEAPASKRPAASKPDDENQLFLTFSLNCPGLVKECSKMAILDSARTKTVAGESWLTQYTSNLPCELRDLISVETSTATIMFGDGKRQKCSRSVTLPARFGNLNCHVKTEVVPGDLPLLLSIKTMKRARMTLLMADNIVLFEDGSKENLHILSSGHAAMKILSECQMENLSFFSAEKLADKAVVSKLHVQFGHCRADKLKSLLKSAGKFTGERGKAIDEVCSACETCIQYGRVKAKPVVGLPNATAFNQTLAMDLHFLVELGRSVYYLHMIDVFTRFSVAVIIYDKQPSTVIKCILDRWIHIFGFPTSILTDNGGEFQNQDLRNFADGANIVLKTTAAGSPWSNGVCERHNAILTEMFLKLFSNTKDDPQICLNHATFAKNCMTDVNGFSPYQLVFGRTPRLPNISDNTLPALEECAAPQSEWLATHLQKLSASQS